MSRGSSNRTLLIIVATTGICLIVVIVVAATLFATGVLSASHSGDVIYITGYITEPTKTQTEPIHTSTATYGTGSTTSRYISPVLHPCTSDDQCALNGLANCLCTGTPLQGICECLPANSNCAKHQDCCSNKCIGAGSTFKCQGQGGQGAICEMAGNPWDPVCMGCMPGCSCVQYYVGMPFPCDTVGYCDCTSDVVNLSQSTQHAEPLLGDICFGVSNRFLLGSRTNRSSVDEKNIKRNRSVLM